MKEYLLKLLNESETALSEFGEGCFVGMGFMTGLFATYVLLKLLFRGFKKQ